MKNRVKILEAMPITFFDSLLLGKALKNIQARGARQRKFCGCHQIF
jgi:hypothetical protein